MKKILLFMISCTLLCGCLQTKPNYIPSFSTQKPNVSANAILVFSDKDQVPFEYREIGRIYLKDLLLNQPANQIEKIKAEAAARGAFAVILMKEHKKNSRILSSLSLGKVEKHESRYYGIAITKTE